MKPYQNPESGIDAYDYGDDWIHVHFKDGKTYEYKTPDVASHHLDKMKRLADSQDDLNTYISQHREVYDAGRLRP